MSRAASLCVLLLACACALAGCCCFDVCRQCCDVPDPCEPCAPRCAPIGVDGTVVLVEPPVAPPQPPANPPAPAPVPVPAK
jgi:hypothetical protein